MHENSGISIGRKKQRRHDGDAVSASVSASVSVSAPASVAAPAPAPNTALDGDGDTALDAVAAPAFEPMVGISQVQESVRQFDSDGDPVAVEDAGVPERGDSRAARNGRAPGGMPWRHYSVRELVNFYDEIRAALPPLTLSETNLEEQMLLQYHTLRELQSEVIDDGDVPANQKAQVANTVSSSLGKLADMQDRMYTTERFKFIENTLIRHLRKLPEDVAEAWIKDYEEALSRLTK